jgi:hypothetical protein
MNDGPSVSHSYRPPKITVIFTCNVAIVCHQSAVTKRGASFFLFVVASSSVEGLGVSALRSGESSVEF